MGTTDLGGALARPASSGTVVRVFDNGWVLEALTRIRAEVAGCVDAPVWALSEADVVACLDAVAVVQAQLAVVQAHLVREVEGRGVPAAQHATGTAAWLRQRLRIGASAAARLVELAREVDRRPALDRALAAGSVNPEQAQVIAAGVRELAGHRDVDPVVVDKAETVLIDYAGQFDPAGLRALGARVLGHVAPEIAERVDAAVLARQEARAWQTRTLHLSAVGDGRVRLTGWLDTEAAATLTAALDPLCNPGHRPRTTTAAATTAAGPAPAAATTAGRAAAAGPAAGAGGRDERTPGQRRADALTEICHLALACGDLPINGGDRPQLVITIPYDPLHRQLGTGTLDTGDRLHPTTVRRLACDAHLIPAVLGSPSQILDLGQSRRLITGPLRRALVLRDHGCAFPGCDRPARWCHAHHITPWTHGGPTTLDNAVLLCGHHHRTIHHTGWTVRLAPDKHPEFIPPTYLDPHQHPRRNTYHHRQ